MKRTHFPPILTILIGLLLILGGYQWGKAQTLHALSPSHGMSSSQSVTSPAPNVDLGLFWETWDLLHAKFVGGVDDAKLKEGAIQGMVNAVDDPYTTYLDPDAAKDLGDGLSGSFSGIGAEIGVKDHRLLIIAPLPDSPAAKAGLKPQDEIQQIDNTAVTELTFGQAIKMIRGKDGTTVKFVILPDGAKDTKTVTVTRGQIVVKSVESNLRSDGLGYVKIIGFHEDTSRLLQDALTSFIDAKVTGVILDLRGDPGGLLDQGIDVVSLFQSAGTVVKQQGKDGQVRTFSVTLSAKMPTIPLVVLINKGSASASEIVAGALQDNGRAKLIGETSFGKGSVQELENLSNGGQLKVTIAHWLTPKDRQINGKGIDPDIVVTKTDADDTAGRDPQLDRAVQELKK